MCHLRTFGLLKLTFVMVFASGAIKISTTAEPLTLTILHTNDVHSRFLETNKHSGGCSEEEKNDHQCYAGFSRIHYKVCEKARGGQLTSLKKLNVKEIRRTHPNVVYLSAGDYFQGTVWYTLFKWEVVARFVNQFQHTAMALGNHEFDDGVDGLIPFLNNVTFPVISCNIDASKEPSMAGKIKKSVVVEYQGRKVGIIGYTTTETMDISNPGELLFENEVMAISKEAKRLYESGVKILIAVGHAGYDVDMKIAQVPYIDVVVGGHTNTFLYSGDTLPDVEQPLGKYPTVITTNNRKVPVVQAYAYGKYLGYLNVTFDENGEVTSWTGNPILLNSSVPQDKDMEMALLKVGASVLQDSKKHVGKTHVFLDGSALTCRMEECNLGSLIGDAMVDMNIKFADDLSWSDVSIAILNGGSVRSSIDEKSRNGSISLEDILTVFPFQNTIDLIEIEGKWLRAAFEFSAEGYDTKGFHLAGKFLQVSGVRVVYDTRRPEGHRVRQLDVLCRRCRVPKYGPLIDTEVYKIAIPTYTAMGGDGYKMIQKNLITYHRSGILDSDMILEYLLRRSPITQGLDGRIKVIRNDADDVDTCNGQLKSLCSLTGKYILVSIILILKFIF